MHTVHRMVNKLGRLGNDLALVIDDALLRTLGIDAETELELSTDGDVLVVAPIRDRKRTEELVEIVAQAHEKYGGVFKRLAE